LRRLSHYPRNFIDSKAGTKSNNSVTLRLFIRLWHYIAIAGSEAEAKLLAEERYSSIVGTPEQVVEQLRPFIELGIEYLMFEFVDFPSMKGSYLFEKEVIPKLGLMA